MSWEIWRWRVNHCCVLVSREVNICHFVLCTSRLTPHTSHFTHTPSHLIHYDFTPHTSVTHFTPHLSHFALHCSHLVPHSPLVDLSPLISHLPVSHRTPQASPLTPHTSHVTPQTSQLTSHTSHPHFTLCISICIPLPHS